jgi:hypothetical protein
VTDIVRFLFGNWFAKVYLIVVAILVVLFFWAGRFGSEETSLGATFLLIFATVPWSLIMPSPASLPAGWLGNVILFGGLAIAALINAALVSLVVHGVRRLIRSRA